MMNNFVRHRSLRRRNGTSLMNNAPSTSVEDDCSKQQSPKGKARVNKKVAKHSTASMSSKKTVESSQKGDNATVVTADCVASSSGSETPASVAPMEVVQTSLDTKGTQGNSVLSLSSPSAEFQDRLSRLGSDHSMDNRLGPRSGMTSSAVSKDESKLKKILTRVISGVGMVIFFAGLLYCGHVYLCGVIFLVEVMLFRELVRVRYNTFFHIIEEQIPLFRTTQWMWFWTAIFYTYGDFIVDTFYGNYQLHSFARFQGGFAFLVYSATFVLTISTLQKDHIRFQLNQLCWTILVLCLTVGQLKYIMHNVYNGLIWAALPIMLVVSNDSFAWLSGVTCGRKFIHREFMRLSPNKTWEGFIGGWIGTMVFGWHLSAFMAQFPWMVCPTNEFSLIPEPLDCDMDPIFHEATNTIPSQVFELLPQAIVQTFPGIVNICMVDGDASVLTACISGEERHSHHHFELRKKMYPIQIHALGLAMFASLVAPFGGFLASGIKRAYGIKDFDSIIPGHGGMMDRMDCQLLMALCTWVHYNTFVKMTTISIPKMIHMYQLMKKSEQEEFFRKIVMLEAGRNDKLLADIMSNK